MALKINTSFQGANIYAVDPESRTWRKVVEDAAGDLALMRYMLGCGGSGPSSSRLLNHSGFDGTYYRGALLKYPLAQFTETEGRGLWVASAAAKTGYVRCFPVYLPPGEDTIYLAQKVLFNPGDPKSYEDVTFDCELFDTASNKPGGTPIDTYRMPFFGEDPLNKRATALFTGLTGDKLHFIFIKANYAQNYQQSWRWGRCQVFWPKMNGGQAMGVSTRNNNGGEKANPVDCTSTASECIPDFVELGSGAFANDYGMSGYHIQSAIKNQNSIAEFATGAPAFGNASYTLADGSATAPTNSAFWDGSQEQAATGSGWDKGSEPLWTVPILTQSFGAMDSTDPNDGGLSSGTYSGQGVVDPVPTTSTSTGAFNTGYYEHVCYLPHMPNSNLKCVALVSCKGAPTASEPLLSLVATDGTTGYTGTQGMTWTSGAGTSGSEWGWATATTSDAHWDEVNQLRFRFEFTAKQSSTSFSVLGVHWYVSP